MQAAASLSEGLWRESR